MCMFVFVCLKEPVYALRSHNNIFLNAVVWPVSVINNYCYNMVMTVYNFMYRLSVPEIYVHFHLKSNISHRVWLGGKIFPR